MYAENVPKAISTIHVLLIGPSGSHRLDIVLADELAWSNFEMRAFDYRLGRPSVTFHAVPVLWQLKRKSQSAGICVGSGPVFSSTR
jgi:hypothetical protein